MDASKKVAALVATINYEFGTSHAEGLSSRVRVRDPVLVFSRLFKDPSPDAPVRKAREEITRANCAPILGVLIQPAGVCQNLLVTTPVFRILVITLLQLLTWAPHASRRGPSHPCVIVDAGSEVLVRVIDRVFQVRTERVPHLEMPLARPLISPFRCQLANVFNV